jgi:hypothetical protein
MIYGVAIIGLSYVHLIVAMIVGGLMFGLFREENNGS